MPRRRLRASRSRARRPGHGRGSSSGGSSGSSVEALLELDADDERAGQEVGLGQAALVAAHLLERLGHAFVDRRRTPGSGRPARRCGHSRRGDRAGIVLAADLEVVGGGEGDVVGHAEPLGLGRRRPSPSGAATRTGRSGWRRRRGRAGGRGTRRGPARLASGMAKATRRQRAVPAPAGGVLGVGETGALHAGAEGPHALRRWRGSRPRARRRRGRTGPRPPAGAGTSAPGRPVCPHASATGYSSSATIVPSWWAMPSTSTRVGISTPRSTSGRSFSPRSLLSLRPPPVNPVTVESTPRCDQTGTVTSCAGRTPSCRGRPSDPSGDRRDRSAGMRARHAADRRVALGDQRVDGDVVVGDVAGDVVVGPRGDAG